jgi:hypothetical protein
MYAGATRDCSPGVLDADRSSKGVDGGRSDATVGESMPLACLVAIAMGAARPAIAEAAGQHWRDVVGFSEAQVAAVESGQIVTRVLTTREDNDVVIAGAIRVDASKETVVAGLRDLSALGGARVIASGRFSDPARLEDLAGLELDRQDLIDLTRCRRGDCDLKLGEAGMEIARQVDWRAPTAAAAAERLLKQVLIDAITAYRSQGAMAVYLDNEVPEKVGEELDKVLEDSPHPAPDSDLLRYALQFPRATLEGFENVFYWSKTNLQKSVVSLHHLVIQKEGEGPAVRFHVADKHILDSHYFLGYLDVLTVSDESPGARSCYVTQLNRTRIDPPRRFRGMLLKKVTGRMKELMEEDLRLLKVRLESPSRRRSSGPPAD